MRIAPEVLQQGSSDGLCGIYCIVNLLRRTDWSKDPIQDHHSILRYVLDICSENGWLSPYTLCWGFDAYQLVGILNEIFDRFSSDYAVCNFDDLDENLRKNNDEFIDEICLKRDGFIITGNGKDHWILLGEDGGELVVFDSNQWKISSQKPEWKIGQIISLDSYLDGLNRKTPFDLKSSVVIWSSSRTPKVKSFDA